MNSIAPSVTDQMTQIYIFVDDYLKEHPAQAAWRRSNNDTPRFTDAEVITIGLLQRAFGCATLKKTDQLVAANWRSLPAPVPLQPVDCSPARPGGSGRSTHSSLLGSARPSRPLLLGGRPAEPRL